MLMAAIDIGGTKVKYGVVDGYGKIKSKGSIDTHPEKGALDLLSRIAVVITIEKKLHGKLMASFKQNLTLKMASAGNDAGLLGATHFP